MRLLFHISGKMIQSCAGWGLPAIVVEAVHMQKALSAQRNKIMCPGES
jgi:hypothetical protein